MSSPWKTAAKDFLRNQDEKALRTSLRKEWIDLYPEEKVEIYSFLFNGEQYKLFMYLFAVDLKSQILEIPWVQALQILADSKIKIDPKFQAEIIQNFEKIKMISQPATGLIDLIAELKIKDRKAFLQKVLKKKQELLASARIAQSEQLVEKHVFYMEELKKISPREYNVSHLITDREKERAHRIISKFGRQRTRIDQPQEKGLLVEEKSILSHLVQQAEEFIQSKRVRHSDLAFLFRSMDADQKAIDFIYQNPDQEKKDWQLLDYLFAGKQYVSLLDHCQTLKQKYAQYPDALFSVSYAEAVAYWELGEKEKALGLMTQIASMRPGFKSASETLAQWKEESFE